jgi:hypothetical protein
LAILLAGCTKTPVIQVSNERNQSGGYVYEYRFESGSALPGCAYASNAIVSVTITATDLASNSPAFASVDVINCVW